MSVERALEPFVTIVFWGDCSNTGKRKKGEKDDGRSAQSTPQSGGGERGGSHPRIDSPGGSEPVARRRFSSLLRHAGVSEKLVSTPVSMTTGLERATGGRDQILQQFQSRVQVDLKTLSGLRESAIHALKTD